MMIDKQIIIDGIDVSGCEAYKKRHCLDKTSIMFCKTNLCSNFPNCYYKQLKRKEQELQEAMDNYVKLDNQRVKEYNELVNRYTAKEQECEELRKIINEAKNSKLDLKSFLVGEAVQNEYEQQLDQLKAENDELKKCYKNNSALLDFEETNTTKLVNKVMKLEKTLTEIKEIARVGAFYWKHYKEESKRYNEILQKISEVEE